MRLPVKKTGKLTFESHPEVCHDVGTLIFEAANNEGAFNEFARNAADKLVAAGIDPEAFKSKKVVVVRDDETTVHVIIPHEVKDEKEKTELYLQELGFVTIMGCR